MKHARPQTPAEAVTLAIAPRGRDPRGSTFLRVFDPAPGTAAAIRVRIARLEAELKLHERATGLQLDLFARQHGLRVAQIVRTVLRFFPVDFETLFSRCRQNEVVDARHAVMNLLYDEGLTMQHIGRIFARDHSTVVHACKIFTGKLESSPALRARYTSCRAEIASLLSAPR